MRVIFIIILVYKIKSAENSESKYIDLLPDKEKEEFLEKIARRIIEEVQAKSDRPKQSGEISEDQLNEHDAYVRKLLKEEAQNLRKKAGEETNNNPSPDVSIVSLDKKDDINNDDRYIDPTLRTGNDSKKVNNRRVFTGFSLDHENNSEHGTESRDESDVDIQIKNNKTSKENVEKSAPEEIKTTYSENNSTEAVTTTKSSLIISDNPSAVENLDSNQKIYAPIYNRDNVSHNSDKYSEEYDPKSSKKTNYTVEYADTVLKNSVNSKKTLDVYHITNGELITIAASTEAPHNVSSRFIRSYEKKLESIIKQDNSKLDTSSSKDNTVKAVLDDSKVINIELTSATETTVFADMPYVIKIDEMTNADQPSTGINISDTKTTTIPTTTRTEELTTTSTITKLKGKEMEVLKGNNVFTQNDDTKHDENKVEIDLANHNKLKINDQKLPKKDQFFVNGLINVLRQNVVEEDKNSSFQLDKNKIKEYKVYEISPDAAPFVKKKTQKIKPMARKIAKSDNHEQPYYVPIYDYSPKNAFYNPNNIFGPDNDNDKQKDLFKIIANGNEEKDNNEIVKDNDVIQAIVKDKNHNLNKFDWAYYISHDPHLQKFRFSLKEPNSGKNELGSFGNLPRAINNLRLVDSNLNPTDYLDIDTRNPLDPERKDGFYTNTQLTTIKDNLRSKGNSKTSSNPYSSSLFDPKFEYSTDAVRRIRQLLFQTKNWSFIKPIKGLPTTSEPEYDDSSEPGKTGGPDEPGEPSEAGVPGEAGGPGEGGEPGGAGEPNKPSESTKLRKKKKKKVLMRSKNGKIITKYFDDRTGSVEKYLESVKTQEPYYIRYRHKNRTYRIPLRSNTTEKPSNVGNGKYTDYNLAKKIIDMVTGSEIMTILQKLHEADIIKAQRTREISTDLDVYVTVMSDLIKENSKGLIQYNWLETTVDLQSAIKKMVDMTESIHNMDLLHPSDLELLKYLVYLHNTAKKELDVDDFENELRLLLLPKSKKKKGIIKEKGLLNRAWLVRMLQGENPISDVDLENFEGFLDDLQTALHDLHTSIKYVSMVTTFKTQKWFKNLKEIHIDSKRQTLLELILHMCTARLIYLIETNVENGLQDDYMAYIKGNEKEVAKTKDEFVFVLKLLAELKQIK